MLVELALYLLAFLSAAIVAVHLALGCAVLLNHVRGWLEGRRSRQQPRLPVSVLVAAKDEEKFLPVLLASLEAQTFLRFQIVLVDDRSTDGTAAIMEEFRARLGERVKVVHNRQEPGGMNPKQCALDIAVRAAAGELLLFTDADCVVPPEWVRGLLAFFSDPRVGIVFGQLSLPAGGGFLERFQAFDQPLIHQWNLGTAGLGMPGSCFGNNLAARRSVIDEVGGFHGLGDTPTEDAALVAAAAKRRWKVRVAARRSTMIVTRPQDSWAQFLNQHLRWNTGAFYHSDAGTRLPYRAIVLFLLASVLAVPFSPFFVPLAMLPAASFISVGLMAFLAGLQCRRDLGGYLLRLLPYTLFFLVFYSFVTLLSIFKIAPLWKGRRLER